MLGPRSIAGQSPLPRQLRYFISGVGTRYLGLESALRLLIRVCATGDRRGRAEMPTTDLPTISARPQPIANDSRPLTTPGCAPCVCRCKAPPPCPALGVGKPNLKNPLGVANLTKTTTTTPSIKTSPTSRLCPTRRQCPKCEKCPDIVKGTVIDVGQKVSSAAGKGIDDSMNKVSNQSNQGLLYNLGIAFICSFGGTIAFLICLATERCVGSSCISPFINSITNPYLICLFHCLSSLTRKKTYINPISGKSVTYREVAALRRAHLGSVENVDSSRATATTQSCNSALPFIETHI